jgi:hypothetical protein
LTLRDLIGEESAYERYVSRCRGRSHTTPTPLPKALFTGPQRENMTGELVGTISARAQRETDGTEPIRRTGFTGSAVYLTSASSLYRQLFGGTCSGRSLI